MPRQLSPWLSEVWGAEGTLGHIPPATGDKLKTRKSQVLFYLSSHYTERP